MRHLTGHVTGPACALAAVLASILAVGTGRAMTAAPLALPGRAPLPVEYFCSPGFEPGRGGTCVAVPSPAEIELFVDQPIFGEAPVRRLRHRRRPLRARF